MIDTSYVLVAERVRNATAAVNMKTTSTTEKCALMVLVGVVPIWKLPTETTIPKSPAWLEESEP